MTAIRSVVLGCGAYLPRQILTNAELAARIDTSDEWIVQRTGIRQRHIAAEGTARQISDFLRAEISKSLMAKIGYLFAKGAFRALRDKLDPKKSNGGVLLGLRGVVVKSHGGTDAEGFAYAIDYGYEMVRYDLLTKINEMLNRDGGALSSVPTSQEAVS